MAQPIIIRNNPNALTPTFIDRLQDLLAAMTYLQGANTEYWFSKIYPFVEIAQQDGQPVILSHKNQYQTLLNDKEKATVFFYINSPITEPEANTRMFEYSISLFVWYSVAYFSKSRAMKLELINQIYENVFRRFGNYENFKASVDWQDVWRGFDMSQYFEESTQPFDCVRIDFTTIYGLQCLPTWQSDIDNLENCN